MNVNLKKIVLLLIEDSIVNTKLINTLQQIGIDASIFASCCPTAVFQLMEFENKEKDEIYNLYFELIKEGEAIDFTNSRKELNSYAEKVYFQLLKQKNK